jgi:hypothetical protein
VHSCGWSPHIKNDDFDTPWDERYCDEAYQTGSSFIWAIYQRYPLALKSPCCVDFRAWPLGSASAVPTLDEACVRTTTVSAGVPVATTDGPFDFDYPDILRGLPNPFPQEDRSYDTVTVILDGAELL